MIFVNYRGFDLSLEAALCVSDNLKFGFNIRVERVCADVVRFPTSTALWVSEATCVPNLKSYALTT